MKTAILGGGIAGLSAAWQLARSGWSGVEIFELEGEPGGNSRAATYEPCKAPWAAHYLPVPTEESKAVRALLQEMGLMRMRADGRASFQERHLCHPLQERLWYRGRWHESLVPANELGPDELGQWRDFQETVAFWKLFRDSQGRKAFALPLDYSSKEPELLLLDKISFGRYAQERGWVSPFMQWLLEYAVRDDYGGGLEQVSAWAGLHYFCSRDGGNFRDADAVFVWPEGNQRITQFLTTRLENPVRTRHLVTSVVPGEKVEINLLDLKSKRPVRILADSCIYCLPTFQRSYHISESMGAPGNYAPWVTANIVLKRAPKERSIYSEPAWDNVLYGSPSLGYVVASHQLKARSNVGPNVWTWYRSFPGEEPKEVRKRLLDSRWSDWRDQVLDDLEVVHPDIAEVTERVDIALFGHGMITPTVDYIWGKARQRALKPLSNVWFAHSDLSGISIFEEAQYQGVRAAEELMRAKEFSFRSLLK